MHLSCIFIISIMLLLLKALSVLLTHSYPRAQLDYHEDILRTTICFTV